MDSRKKMSSEEKVLVAAAARYAKVEGVPLTKMSWVLSSIMPIPENSMLHRLREASQNVEVDQSLESLRKQLIDEGESDVIATEDLEKRLGEVVTVEALSIKTYGVVCKVEGTTRTLLLHLSEIANAFISDIGDYVSVGDKFPALLIVNVKGQLGLSTKRIDSLKKKSDVEKAYKEFYYEAHDL